MCTLYSAWQRLNKDKDIGAFRRRLRAAREHMIFVCELYVEQMASGRLFLHEHPAGASSWEETCIKGVLAKEGVETTITDQCQFGQRSREGDPVKKPTKWMSNCPEILEALSQRCRGQRGLCSKTGTPHRLCSGRVARDAAIYPFAMCRAILEGLRKHLDNRGRVQHGVNSVLPIGSLALSDISGYEDCVDALLASLREKGPGDFVDATTGQVLRKELVMAARRVEMY